MLAALFLFAQTLPADIPNAGFELGLEGWSAEGHRGYRAIPFTQEPGGSRRLSMAWANRGTGPDDAQFRVGTRIDARRYRGRTIRISAAIRVFGWPGRAATLFARAGGAEAVTWIETDQRANHGAEWQRRGVVLAVPSPATEIALGFHIPRAGARIEADDVRIELVD